MRTWVYVSMAVFIALLAVGDPVQTRPEGLYIVTTYPFISDIAGNILGEYGYAESLLRPGRHASTYEFTPSDSEKAYLADLFLYVGYGSELAIASNVAGLRDGEGVLSILDLVARYEPRVYENPYFWHDVGLTMRLVEELASLFSDLAPQYEEVYMENADRYLDELESLDAWVLDMLSHPGLPTRSIFTVRNGLMYYAERYGLEVAGYITGAAGVYEPATAWVVEQFEDVVLSGEVVIIIEYEEMGTTLREVVETLAEEAGLETYGFVVLESLAPDYGVYSYVEMIRWNTEVVREALLEGAGEVAIEVASIDNPLLKPLAYDFLKRGFLTLVVLMAMTSAVGAYAVLRGWSIFSDALGHGAIVGLLMAYLLAMDFYLGALLIGLFIAFTVGTLERVTTLRADVIIAISFTSMLAIATLIISTMGGVNISLEDVLFADVTAVSSEMMTRAVLSALGIGVLLLLFHRHLLLYAIDPISAISMGVRIGLIHYALLLLLAISTVSAFMSIGAIPAIAALIVPPSAAYLVSRRPRQYIGISVSIGVFSGIVGYYLSYYSNVNAGAATILVSVAVFLVCLAIYLARKPPIPLHSR